MNDARYTGPVNDTRGKRRARTAKPSLSMESIVTETIRIMRAEGLERATMRRVADALDTGQASLYVYVDSTVGLHSAVLEHLLGSLTVPVDGGWRVPLRQVLRSYAEMLFENPGLARSALLQRPTGPNAVRLYERILSLLLAGGVEQDRAAWGVDLLLLHVTASAAEHSPAGGRSTKSRVAQSDGLGALRGAFRDADAGEAPNVVRLADALVAGTPVSRMTWALDVLIDGIASTPVPSD